LVVPKTRELILKRTLEKQLLKTPGIYRFIARFRKNANADKYVFSQYIKKGDTVIDCGANIGYYTNFFRAIVGKKGYVHAFEPVPSTFEYLSENTMEYSNCNNYYLNMVGLYKEESTKNIYIPDSISGHASLKEHQKAWNANKIDKKEIKLITLDSYVKKNVIKKVDFIKIDVEGAEIDVLNGSKQTLLKNKPNLHLEVNSELLNASQQTVHKLWELLKELHYKKIYYYDENPKLMKDFCKLKNTENKINTNLIALN
jgi:FkbM family methyltransferase